MNERINRDLSTREKTQRKRTWQPPNLLPDPPTDPNYRYKWVRLSTVGQSDLTNASKKLREGWEWVRPDDPVANHIKYAADSKPSMDGIIEIGGLALARMPEEMAQDRESYYRDMVEQQIESADKSYLKENDPRMPVMRPERKTEISKI